ncbi:hypothetical protein [uncultured Roseobacter sp.]|uniref:COG3904 family protein n=1 Tax=uncultured Roseobacter sp. TaxID=114847 RepID=UPI0026155E8E|nr:hypothetical protein [uncultured Roseobacter sp.]
MSTRRGITTRGALTGLLALQILLALLLMGRDLLSALPAMMRSTDQPAFDTPVAPGDQRRQYAPRDLPLRPADGPNVQQFTSSGDMPRRLDFDRQGEVLVLTGQIAEGDAARVTDALEAQADGLVYVRLNSPGGSVTDALAIGRDLRARGLETVAGAGDICLSACPYIFAAGVARRAHEDAQIGVHQHFFGASSALPAYWAVEVIQRGQADVMRYLDAMGVDTLVMQHALATPPDEIYVLLPEELETYRMVTEGGPGDS